MLSMLHISTAKHGKHTMHTKATQKLISCSNTIFWAQVKHTVACIVFSWCVRDFHSLILAYCYLPSFIHQKASWYLFHRNIFPENDTRTLLSKWLKFGFCVCYLRVFCLLQQVSQYRVMTKVSAHVISRCFKLDTSLDDIVSYTPFTNLG